MGKTTGVGTRLPSDVFNTRKSSGYSKSGTSVAPDSRYSRSYTRSVSKSGGSKFTVGKSSPKSGFVTKTGGSKLMVPTKSGYRGSSRSGRSGYSKSKTGVSRTGMTGRSQASASGWQPTGNMVEIDEAELAELERMIMALTERAEGAETRVAQLHQIPVRDVLQFIIKNSNTANVTIGDEVCPVGWKG